MRATGSHGHIVNISSVAARSPASGVYGATKHAVNVISESLRQELFEDPIKITTVMPGLVATNIGRNVDVAILEGIVAMSGIDYTVKAGERLPDDVLQNAASCLERDHDSTRRHRGRGHLCDLATRERGNSPRFSCDRTRTSTSSATFTSVVFGRDGVAHAHDAA